MTPSKIVYGREPPRLLKIGGGQTQVNSVKEHLLEHDLILDELPLSLTKAHQIMKRNADLKRRDEIFEVGEGVYRKLQPYKQQSLAKRPFEKLAARFYGPFEVIQKVEKVAYKLKLPITCKLHPVFNVSQLKRAVGSQLTAATIPDQITP